MEYSKQSEMINNNLIVIDILKILFHETHSENATKLVKGSMISHVRSYICLF